ncbi:serine/threonine kinase [Emydomyces testavorans]|uniref:non-specific serine/threonine protein kinase n=1 Tax=Emydomyces testavorans TaxID=2070801 RepID=A0AAF0DG32_9EURO|nr:serine/threonine kinase [Emydomyces testavorans]
MRLVRAGCSLRTLVPRAASLGLPVLPQQRYQPPRRSRSTTVVHRRAMATLGAAPLNPRHFLASGFTELDPAIPIEEELLPNYIAEMYYPVHIGEVLNDRYQLVCKLGYGTTSTVWLARDLRNTDDSFTYVALKIYVNRYIKRHETVIYERINAASNVKRHPGCRFVRKLLTSFTGSTCALFTRHLE